MKHISQLKPGEGGHNGKDLLARAAGRFYTPTVVGERLAGLLADELLKRKYPNGLTLIDPFCGDGRLLVHLLKAVSERFGKKCPKTTVLLWDNDSEAVQEAEKNVKKAVSRLGLNAQIGRHIGDSFEKGLGQELSASCVITNPPWETLKPDKRELHSLSEADSADYIAGLKAYDNWLATSYPVSQPAKKFSGWGTNLSRCGLELSLKLLSGNAVCGIVLPLSVTSDQMSIELRKWMLDEFALLDVAHYPAEAKLFAQVDQNVVTLVVNNAKPRGGQKPRITSMDRTLAVVDEATVSISKKVFAELDYCMPQGGSRTLVKLLNTWSSLPTLADLEKHDDPLLLGRELDETNHTKWLTDSGRVLFVKGRMIDRYGFCVPPQAFVDEDQKTIPVSAQTHRIVWRDVSRRSQSRRMRAAIISPGHVTGNSLHIAKFATGDQQELRALLVLMNSLPFEYQMHCRLGTGHLSLGVVRKTHVPDFRNTAAVEFLDALLENREGNEAETDACLEVACAILYGLSRRQYEAMLKAFDGLTQVDKNSLLLHPLWIKADSIAGLLHRPRAVAEHGDPLQGPCGLG